MAQTISIGTTQHIDFLKAKLGRELKKFKRNGMKIELEERPAGKFTFLAFRITDQESTGYSREATHIVRQHLADIISENIISYWEDSLLQDIIRDNYYYFGEEEKKVIYNYALRHMNRDGNECRNTLYWLNRKSKILHKVLDFMHQSNRIIIDGFIKFRLKEYTNELRDAADKAVDDFLMEREYREFVNLLKYFVDIQEPKVEVLHVLIRGNGTFKLYDNNLQPIRSDYLEGYLTDLADNEINYEDLLISALITIAPGTIILHYKKENGLCATLDTIKNVFYGRVSECKGCSLCLSTLRLN